MILSIYFYLKNTKETLNYTDTFVLGKSNFFLWFVWGTIFYGIQGELS